MVRIVDGEILQDNDPRLSAQQRAQPGTSTRAPTSAASPSGTGPPCTLLWLRDVSERVSACQDAVLARPAGLTAPPRLSTVLLAVAKQNLKALRRCLARAV